MKHNKPLHKSLTDMMQQQRNVWIFQQTYEAKTQNQFFIQKVYLSSVRFFTIIYYTLLLITFRVQCHEDDVDIQDQGLIDSKFYFFIFFELRIR